MRSFGSRGTVLCLFTVIMMRVEGEKSVTIRLMDGKNPFEGRVEVKHSGIWGTICNNGNWDIWDAYVVCHMLNYSKGVTARTALVKGTGPILLKLTAESCKGYEESIVECAHNGWGNTAGCDHKHDAGVVCANLTQEENAIEVRLEGDQRHTGKVEIQYQGDWRVVCDYKWSLLNAHVICRMLGYKAAEQEIRYIEGETTRRTLIYDVRCSGREESIAECAHQGFRQSACWSKRLAGVVCQTNQTYPPPVQVCLAGGMSANSGRLDVRYHGQWGTVCDDRWDKEDAEVVCRMLGYPGVQEYTNTNFTDAKGIIWLVGVDCSGTEISIAKCGHSSEWGMSNCKHDEDVGLTCKIGTSPTKMNTTLLPNHCRPTKIIPTSSNYNKSTSVNAKEEKGEAADLDSTTKSNNYTVNDIAGEKKTYHQVEHNYIVILFKVH